MNRRDFFGKYTSDRTNFKWTKDGCWFLANLPTDLTQSDEPLVCNSNINLEFKLQDQEVFLMSETDDVKYVLNKFEVSFFFFL